MWRNGPNSFGRVTRALHWAMAALILCQIALGLYTARMAPGLANLWLYGLHKTLGIGALGLALVRMLWHLFSPPPPPVAAPSGWQMRAARLTHRALYALMILLPVTGWFASSASGLDTLILNRWVLPPIAPADPRLEAAGFALHAALGWAMTAALALHMAGVLHRAIRRDGTLSRMLWGPTG